MAKAWCCWCENGERKSTSGYHWIHLDCANEMMDISSDIKTIKEILKGEHPRNEDNGDKLDLVIDFLKDMEDFRRRWEGTMNLFRQLGVVDSKPSFVQETTKPSHVDKEGTYTK